jgi:hypothetical protein
MPSPFEIADALRACLDAAYAGDDGKPAEICHRPGAEVPFSLGSAQDECCTGLGWVRVASVEPVMDAFSTEDPDASPCDVFRSRITLELGVARCNPYGNRSSGPSCEVWTELALRMDLDRGAMRRAVCCLVNALGVGEDQEVYRIVPGAWTPLDASGGCAGGTYTVTAYTDCSECV